MSASCDGGSCSFEIVEKQPFPTRCALCGLSATSRLQTTPTNSTLPNSQHPSLGRSSPIVRSPNSPGFPVSRLSRSAIFFQGFGLRQMSPIWSLADTKPRTCCRIHAPSKLPSLVQAHQGGLIHTRHCITRAVCGEGVDACQTADPGRMSTTPKHKQPPPSGSPTLFLGNTRWKASPELPSLALVRVAWCHDVMLGGPNGLRGMAAGARQRAVEAGPEQNDGDGEPRC